MKKLDINFESKGFKFKQIHREKNYAIYERQYDTSDIKHYEVIRIQSHNGYEIFGKKIPPSECYPTSNSWGTNGFTCVSRQAAYDRLDRIMKEDMLNKEAANKKAERKKSK